MTSIGRIQLRATNNSQVGTHTATVTVYLQSFPTVKVDLTPFTITITPCVVTSVQVVAASNNASLSTRTYTMSSTNTLSYQLYAM